MDQIANPPMRIQIQIPQTPQKNSCQCQGPINSRTPPPISLPSLHSLRPPIMTASRAGGFRSPLVTLLPLLLLLLFTTVPTALSWRPWPHTLNANAGVDLNTSKKYEGSSEFVHLRYHMGPVLTANVTVHLIWYGAWAPSQKRVIRAFIRSISPHEPESSPKSRKPEPSPGPSVAGWWRTVQLYTDQTGSNITRTVRLGEEKNDRRYSHGKRLTRLSVQSVIRDAVTATTRPLPINPRGGMYFVLTSADVGMEDFCGQVRLFVIIILLFPELYRIFHLNSCLRGPD